MRDEMTDLLGLTANIVSSHVANNSVATNDLPTLISNVYTSLSRLGSTPEPEAPKQEPAVSIRSSIKPEYLVCLEDGKKLQMLRRHLMTSYGMAPDAYRAKWGLPFDYPMVAPNYADRRRTLALKIGLGAKRDIITTAPAPVEVAPESAEPAPASTDEALIEEAPKAKRERPTKRAAADAEVLPRQPKPVRRRKLSVAVEPNGES